MSDLTGLADEARARGARLFSIAKVEIFFGEDRLVTRHVCCQLIDLNRHMVPNEAMSPARRRPQERSPQSADSAVTAAATAASA